MSEIRVRFAPSPTGYLHVGGARTALFNWLYARQNGGKFILRIEDTDTERSTTEATETILAGLRWLGIDWDEGPFFQTANAEFHREHAQRMIDSGHAYRCFCSKELLDSKRKAAEAQKVAFKYDGTCRRLTASELDAKLAEDAPFVVRFAVPLTEGAVTWQDLVYGDQSKQYSDIEDFVMLRTNRNPLYVLSNVVDDALQNVTHVIRGQDGLSNTPKQILMYQALGYSVPTFAHLPLILDNKRAKLSKRVHGDVVTVKLYQEQGFVPDALVNFLALLGWSPGNDQELMTRAEMMQAFSFSAVNHSNAVFNFNREDPRNWTDPKALWMNSEYINKSPLDYILPLVMAELQRTNLWQPEFATTQAAWFRQTVDILRARYRTLPDFSTLGRAYFADDFVMDDAAVKKNLKDPALSTLLPGLADKFAALPEFTLETTEQALREFAEAQGVKAGLLINAARTALTGQAVGPGIFEVIAAVGQPRSVGRLRQAINCLAV
jgi:glutamyl-tRNA synthetase